MLYIEAKCWGTISAIKKLSNTFSDKRIKQLKNYCKANSVKLGAFTDGGAWFIFDFSSDGKLKIVTFIDAANAERKDVKQLMNISRKSIK